MSSSSQQDLERYPVSLRVAAAAIWGRLVQPVQPVPQQPAPAARPDRPR